MDSFIFQIMMFCQNYNVGKIIELSQECSYQDVTIICHNGTFQSNSFLLAALFPMFRNILKTSVQSDESYVMSMPEMDKNVLDEFWQNLQQRSPNIYLHRSIQQLLEYSIKIKKEDETDYSLLDLDFEIVNNDELKVGTTEIFHDKFEIDLQ